MNWLTVLPLGFILLMVLFAFLSLKVVKLRGLRRVLPQLLILFFLSLAIVLLNSHFIKKVFYSEKVLYVLWLLFFFFVMVLAVKLIALVFFDFLFIRRVEATTPRLVKDVAVFILYIIGLLLILNYYLNIKITVLLASSAILTVVVGFALQDILGNLFSGIVLNFEDSLKLGDWVTIGGHTGKIEQFRWRSIKIKTIDNELILIPNQFASKEKVLIIESVKKPFALKFYIGVGYRLSPDFVIETIRQVLQSFPWIRNEPLPSVLVWDFADFAIVYEVKFWTSNYLSHNFFMGEVRRKIWYVFKRNGIEIPFPIRNVYIKKEEEVGLSKEELTAALRQNAILQTIDEKQFQNLLEGLDCQMYGRGETIIREGDAGDYFYHILSGRVEVEKAGQVVAVLESGDFFGEISLVTGDKTTATVVAAQESAIARVSSKRFKQTVKVNESMARKLSEVIVQRQTELKEFSEKERLTDSRLTRKDSDNLFRRILKYFGKS